MLREWLGAELKVHPKEITLIGSGRLGSSLAPPPNTGRQFGGHSDLDWSIISEHLFGVCSADFTAWSAAYHDGLVHPHNAKEQAYWDDNLKRIPVNISRGFIDPYKVPSWYEYPTAQRINQTMSVLAQRIKKTQGAPVFTKAHLRVFRHWSSFVRQASLNLRQAARKYVATLKS